MFLVLVVFLALSSALCEERIYYIAIREEIWDYAPSGMNLITNESLYTDEDASVFYKNATNRIGGRYKKAIYRQYTDDSFTKEILKDASLGFLGPTILGEIGDVITIHAKNFASRNFSLHPHGVNYKKLSEGAVYVDGEPTTEKVIMPNQKRTYTWNMHEEYGPSETDPACATYVYHSHIDTMRDTYSGLLGAMLVCRKGTLDGDGKRKDVDQYFVLNFYVIDENLSWYIDDNIKLFCSDADVDKEDDDFIESNTMHAVNGLGYGNLEGITACEGDTVGFNMIGFGNEADIHSVQFEAQTILLTNHRGDSVNLFAAIFKAVTMVAANPGKSLIACRVGDHYSAGMYTSFYVDSSCGTAVDTGETNPTKHIYIAIEEQDWDYGPTGYNELTGKPLIADGTNSQTYFEQDTDRIGGIYQKALFVEYDDANFTIQSNKSDHMGLLGPLISVEIGDVIEVTLMNNASQNYNIEPHGLLFTNKVAVRPGENHTFKWTAPSSVSPTDLDSDCISYLYTSTVDPVKDTYSGLIGPLLLCKKGTLADALTRNAYYLLFAVMDENQSHYLETNIQSIESNDTLSIDREDEDFQESNLMHSINGRMYGNLKDITLCVGRETDFHVIGLGTEVDMHSMFASGVNIRVRNENTAVASIFPQTTTTTTVIPSQSGSGQIKCVLADHIEGGMVTTYEVSDGCGKVSESSGVVRTYYIAAVEENWDYVNGSKIDTLGRSLSDPDVPGYVFVHKEKKSRIGSTYKKAMYFEYTDKTFTKRMEKNPNRGLLGPVIAGEVGDTIKIVFKNMASRNYSITPWGAKDTHDLFNSRSIGVAPGEIKNYEWKVPDNAVPPDDQPGCNSWIYKSNVDEIKDVYSGLIGPLLLCRKGFYNSAGGTKGYDEDFYLLFLVFDENMSHYLEENMKTFASIDDPTGLESDEDFHESNLMHSIDGVIYQLSGLDTAVDDNVLWHLIGYGNEVDIHTVHFHAHAFTVISDVTSNNDVFELFPGKIATVQMKTTEVGRWLMHCHVDDHLQAGMVSTFYVKGDAGPSSMVAGWGILIFAILSAMFSM